MTSKEKRGKIVKEVIKPIMKEAGYKCSGSTWYSQREACYVVVHMQNSIWNSDSTGIQFWFNIDALSISELDNINQVKKWINSFSMINEYVFLPKCGLLHEFRSGLSGYKIDGYRNYLHFDTDVEDLSNHIIKDFKQYILPKLQMVNTINEWEQLKDELQIKTHTKENSLLCYYSIANQLACSESNILQLKKISNEYKLTADEIRENIVMLKDIQRIAETVCNNAEEYILKSLKK